ncbi:ABC transporter permease [Nocardioides sp. LHG3406-4]|uniref:ABC transporter permease n=1 Tax=Nocardioides sp. LHG3406-4 TaxID=2804575 RepID=UPI003CF0F8A9
MTTLPLPGAPAVEVVRQRRERGRPNLALALGLTIFGLIVLAAIFAPLLTSADPLKQDLLSARLAPGSPGHLLGTDELGRDVLARLLYGARVDLRVGVLAVLTPLVMGSLLGLLTGWFGGWLDMIVMRVIDVVVAFPFYILVIALVFALGQGATSIYLAISMVGWVAYCRIVRGQVLVAKEQEYALAARASGLPTWRILIRHLLPNVMLQALVYSMSDIVLTILAIVTLSYLGLGISPPTPEWGSMIAEGQNSLMTQWYLSTIPGLCVVLVGLSLALVADGLVTRFNRR